MSRLNLQTMGYSSMSEICFHTVKLFGMEMFVYVYRATNKLKNVMRDTKPPKKLLRKICKAYALHTIRSKPRMQKKKSTPLSIFAVIF